MSYKHLLILSILFLVYAVHVPAFSSMKIEIDSKQKIKRLALVIGNSSYKDAPLKNPVNDAIDMAKTLRTLGFKVIELTNGNLKQMNDAVNEFGSTLEKDKGVGLFFYAGHAMQSSGLNYLLPVDANIDRETDLKYKALDVGKVLDEMAYADNGLNIAILDSCRDNPLTQKFNSKVKGLARLTDVPTGLLIAYSTSPGKQAQDGTGRNSPYTKHLMQSMKQSNLPIELVFKNVTRMVKLETRKQQIPWMSSSVDSDFYFLKDDKSVSGIINSETILWNEIKQTPSIELYRVYLLKYPKGIFAPIAKQYIKDMRSGKISNKNVVADIKPKFQSNRKTKQTSQKESKENISMDEILNENNFVLVPKGCFFMGSNSAGKNNKQHEVCFSRDFYISKYELTQGAWESVMGANPSYFQICGKDCPVDTVSWLEVQDFINKLNSLTDKKYRLPTESEWEYACTSAGKSQKYCGKNDDIEAFAWIDINASGRTHKVGEKEPNELGIYDMSGNVFEWVSDWYGEYPRSKSFDPQGIPKSFAKVFRGGSFLVNSEHATAVKRRGNKPDGVSKTLGFRLLLEK
ncbi:MAG: SUMF1/EgtB/PvdO family nonheme iron enzyme [Gammaproteobacteria bacterium]|nr:SUMF1/EgtB/PvdO family nonheme iron enzyme [Gammaproteobacteria bacterium]